MVYEMNTIGKSAFWLGVARLSSGLKLGEEPIIFKRHSFSFRRSVLRRTDAPVLPGLMICVDAQEGHLMPSGQRNSRTV
jgi:hypothetical protein